ncbi:MAG: uracil-DNA glycosylase [Acidobacteriota bacterium]
MKFLPAAPPMAKKLLGSQIEQLRAHLEYYQEMGIESLALLKGTTGTHSQRSAEAPAHRNTSLFAETGAYPGETLEKIRQDLGDCQRCKLCAGRTHIVFGSGNPTADLVFVGEGPGADEDAQGLPFVGKAGQLLTRIIEAIELKREEVYICNVVKCRPPGNRFPEPDEISACSPFLFRQLDSIRPKVICCLGAAAAQTVLQTKSAIGKLRGRFHEYDRIPVMVTYHPAYLLRNPAAKRDVWEDMKKVRKALNSEA